MTFHHTMPLALASASLNANGIVNGIIVLLGEDNKNEVQH